MSRPSRTLTAVVLLPLALSLSACERGCLARRFDDRSIAPTVGGEGPRGSARPDGAPSFDLEGTDCSDGLARCVDGEVEVSVAAHVPHPCSSPGEKPGGGCECPWQRVGRCETACVKDGLEVLATAEVARVQLCAAPEPLLRPLLPNELTSVSICAEEGVSCIDGVVRACAQRGQPVRLIAGCAAGCASGVGVDVEDVGPSDGRAAILCRRAHAERR